MRKYLPLLLLLFLFGLGLWFSTAQGILAQTPHQLAQTAQAFPPSPLGQTVHFRYQVYTRPPPAKLEPPDPYHVPFNTIWHEWQTVDTWMEVSPTGEVTRWRTQARSAAGELLQDLVFDGQVETDYFVWEGHVSTVESTKAESYQDPRANLLRYVLETEGLTQHSSHSMLGAEVISVYGPPSPYHKPSDETALGTALMGAGGMFYADLKLVATGLRIDLDPHTHLPVGRVQVGYDAAGQDHVLSYRTFADPEVVPPTDPQLAGLFELQLPP